MEEQYVEQSVPVDFHVSSFQHACRCQYQDNYSLYWIGFGCTTSESLFEVEDQTSNCNARISKEESRTQEWKKAYFGISFSFIDKQTVNT